MRINFKRTFLVLVLFVLIAIETLTIGQLVLTYLHPTLDLPFINTHAKEYLSAPHWRLSFFVHAFLGPAILFTGLISMATMLFQKNLPLQLQSLSTRLHRWCGKFYILAVLFFAAPTGFVMAFFASGGVTAKIAFLILGVLWFWVTLAGYRLVRSKRYVDHSVLMTFSFGLACSAILQRRIVYWIIGIFFVFDLPDPSAWAYSFSAWAGWLTCTVLSLMSIYFLFRKKPKQVIRLIINE